MRLSSDHQRNDIMVLTRALIFNVGAKNLAGMTRVKGPALSKYGTLDDEGNERHIPIDILLDAELLHRHPMVLERLAEFQGYRLVPIEPAEAGETVPSERGTIGDADVLRAVKEVNDVVALYMAARADGIDTHERRIIHSEIDEAISVLAAVRKVV